MALKIDTSPEAWPVSLLEAKEHLRVSGSQEDDYIQNLIKSATYWAESYTGMRLVDQIWIWYLDLIPSGPIIEVPYPPLIDVIYFKYYDADETLTTLIENTDYRIDINTTPGRIEVINQWPGTYSKVNAVEIKFQCGYEDAEDIPDDIKSGTLFRIADLYENRQSEYVSTGPLSATENMTTAKNLFDFYRIFNRSW